MAQRDDGTSTFAQDWPFPSEVKKDLKADSYEVLPSGQKYKSGRDKWTATFYSGRGALRRVVSRRDAMELVSKAGRVYYVCRSRECSEPRPIPSADLE
jgi:hypothetical protein